jgi:hypothetical protein
MYQAQVVEDGWPVPSTDEGAGGDDRIDLYLRALDANGCTHYTELPSGHMAAYVEIAPAGVSFGKVTFESIAGHELHHVLEFNLTDRMPNWIHEATATYFQYLLFDDPILDLAREALWRIRLGAAEKALDAVGDRFEYAGMVWAKYLADHRGTTDRKQLLYLWQALAQNGDWVKGHDAYLAANLGVPSLDDAAADFAVWNWFACGNSDGRHYDPATVGCLNGNVQPTVPQDLPADGTSPTVGHRGSTYLLLRPECVTDELDITVRPTGHMRFQVIEELPQTQSAILDRDAPAGTDAMFTVKGWNDYRRIALVGTNLAGAPSTFTYHIATSGTYAPPLTPPPPKLLTLAPDTLALDAGGSATVTLTATYGTCADGSDVTARATWTSSQPDVATVENGRVVARRGGQVEIFAKIGDVGSNHLTVTVKDAPDGGCRVVIGSKRARNGAFLAVVGLLFSLVIYRIYYRFSHL